MPYPSRDRNEGTYRIGEKEKGLVSDTGSELGLGREREVGREKEEVRVQWMG